MGSYFVCQKNFVFNPYQHEGCIVTMAYIICLRRAGIGATQTCRYILWTMPQIDRSPFCLISERWLTKRMRCVTLFPLLCSLPLSPISSSHSCSSSEHSLPGDLFCWNFSHIHSPNHRNLEFTPHLWLLGDPLYLLCKRTADRIGI